MMMPGLYLIILPLASRPESASGDLEQRGIHQGICNNTVRNPYCEHATSSTISPSNHKSFTFNRKTVKLQIHTHLARMSVMRPRRHPATLSMVGSKSMSNAIGKISIWVSVASSVTLLDMRTQYL